MTPKNSVCSFSSAKYRVSVPSSAPVHGESIPQVGIRIQDELSVQCPTNNPENLCPSKATLVSMMAMSPRRQSHGDGQISG